MSKTTITKTIFISASRELVWSYLTDKNKLGEWFHPAVDDLVAGKPYVLLSDPSDSESKICWGEVLQAEKPNSLSYTFTVGPLGGSMTNVTWTLDEAAGGTRVTLLHEGIAEAAGDAALGLLKALEEGWDEHFSKLRAQLLA